MYFLQDKLFERIKELSRYRYIDMNSILPMRGMYGSNAPTEVYNQIPEVIDDFDVEPGFVLKGKDKYLWLRKEVTIPEAREDCEIAGLFTLGQYGHLVGCESLLYVNGHPYQGVDDNHEEVLMSELAGQTVELTFLSWTGMEGKEPSDPPRPIQNVVRSLKIGYLWKSADKLYYLLTAAMQTLGALKYEVQKPKLEQLVNEVLAILNWDPDKIAGTIPAALQHMQEGLEQFTGLGNNITINAVGHSHIDVAWVWREKHVREKAMRTFATALHFMERYDEYVYLQSSPQIYKSMKEDSPELYERVKERIKDGHWEADGAMWLEADCNLSSGEALVRQLLYGIRFFREEFDKQCSFLWLPDVFGYSWALPQILKKAGIKYFATAKISGNEFNKIPYDIFNWRGIDGSDVIAHLLTSSTDFSSELRFPPFIPVDMSLEGELKAHGGGYEGNITARSLLATWLKLYEKSHSDNALLAYGYGDGGGGPDRNMLELRRALEHMPGLPKVQNSGVGDFFKAVQDKVDKTPQPLPVWDGELYFEYHRGTYTTQAFNKMMNRKLEFKLAETEWLATAAWISGEEYNRDILDRCWQSVLKLQFHDIIPGSSINEVYEDSHKEYLETEETLDKYRNEIFGKLLKADDEAITIFNPTSYARTECVEIPSNMEFGITDAYGNALPVQKTEKGIIAEIPVPAASYATIKKTVDFKKEDSAFKFDSGNIETPYYKLTLDENGNISSLFDKENRREVIAGNGSANRLEVFEDKPLTYDAWNLDIFYMDKAPEYFVPVSAPYVAENGNLRLVVRTEYKYNRSVLKQDMVFYANDRRIDFITNVSWNEAHRMLKAAFDVDIRNTHATYDIQYGYADRTTHYNTSWDYAKFEVCAHKWADLSEGNYGVSILNNCKYGYNIHEKTMKITLLRSPKSPDLWADMGEHTFTYSLYPHKGSIAEGGTIAESYRLNQPVIIRDGAISIDPTLFQISGEGIYIDAVKLGYNENCVVLRFHETDGGGHNVSLKPKFGFSSYTECNLVEDNEGEPIVGAETIDTFIKPFEIKTYKLYL